MNRDLNLYGIESDKSVSQLVADFSAAVEANNFVINNPDTMDMQATLHRHGARVPGDFAVHMIHVCKPAKAAKSLISSRERAILMPKFIHVFSKDEKTQVRFMHYKPEQISAMLPDDPQFFESLPQVNEQICTMIDEAK